MHWTHRPLVVSQAGVARLQAPAPAAPQPAHMFATQKALPGSAEQCMAGSVHWTHLPLVASHAGVAPLHAPAPAPWQPEQTLATQKVLPGSALQCAAASVHWTHRPVVESQAGVAPVQAPAPAIWQPTHRLATQNARAASLQSLGARHATHTPSGPHTGVAAGHDAFPLHRTGAESGALPASNRALGTHLAAATSQTSPGRQSVVVSLHLDQSRSSRQAPSTKRVKRRVQAARDLDVGIGRLSRSEREGDRSTLGADRHGHGHPFVAGRGPEEGDTGDEARGAASD